MASSPVFAVTPRLGVVTDVRIRAAQQAETASVFTAGSSYTFGGASSGHTMATVWAIGGGASSSYTNLGPTYYSGGSGAVAMKTIFLPTGVNLVMPYTIGAGGPSSTQAQLGTRGGDTSFTFNGYTVRAEGGLGSPVMAVAETRSAARSFDADAGANGNAGIGTSSGNMVGPSISDVGGLSATLTSLVGGGASLATYGKGASVINASTAAAAGATGAIVIRFSAAAIPLLTGVANGTRVEEIRFWTPPQPSSPRYSGDLELWLHDNSTNPAALLHTWSFNGTDKLPVVPSAGRWDDLRVRFDNLILPNASWRILVRSTLTPLPNEQTVAPFSVIAQGADL